MDQETGITELLQAISSLRERMAAQSRSSRSASAPDFDLFRFCRSDELGLSEILRWLLDPSETHGQGALFLANFVEVFGIRHEGRAHLDAARARSEVATRLIPNDRRRMDVEVACGDFAIAIENKPYADFQDRQVPDYCEHLARRWPGGYAMVILRGWPQPAPLSQRLRAGRENPCVIDSDYSQVAVWLDACIRACRASAVGMFLVAFRRFVDREFLGGVIMRDQDAILREVDSEDRRRSALDVIASADGLYSILHRDFVAGMQRCVPEGWQVRADRADRAGRQNSAYFHLSVDFGPAFPVLFAFDVHGQSTEGIAGAIERHGLRNSVRTVDRIGRALRETLRVGGPEGRWPWWEHQRHLVEADLLDLEDANVWKAFLAPDRAASAIRDLAARVETIAAQVLR